MIRTEVKGEEEIADAAAQKSKVHDSVRRGLCDCRSFASKLNYTMLFVYVACSNWLPTRPFVNKEVGFAVIPSLCNAKTYFSNGSKTGGGNCAKISGTGTVTDDA